MNIFLQGLIPHPLPEHLISSSDVWGKELLFEEGQLIRIAAQSGKGKSTLLHIIYGLRSDYGGNLEIDKSNTSGFSTDRWQSLRSRELSLMFQDLRLFKHLSARENLSLMPLTDPESPKIEEMCERLKIAHLLELPIEQLSLGQCQRFALIRCLKKPFRWLLLDEPFSHLDKVIAQEAALLVEEIIRAKGAGMVVTSLQAKEAIHCDRLLQL